MSDNNKNNENVDLSQLKDLEFSTAWSPVDSGSSKRDFSGEGFKPSFAKGFKRDFQGKRRNFKDSENKKFDGEKPRKFFGKPKGDKPEASEGENQKEFRSFKGKRGKHNFREQFKFSMEVNFYPEDTSFAKLSELMRHLKRTYQLFEIAKIILEKPERYVVVAKNLPDAEGKSAPLYCVQPLNIPFEDEQSAKEFAIDAKIGEIFDKVQVEVEAPKGNFLVVNKCGFSGELLGAPNWHKYANYVKEFHRQNFPNMNFEKFSSRIVSSNSPEDIQKWVENMKTATVYKLKDSEETFDTYDKAAAYVAQKFGDTLVHAYDHVRLNGVDVDKLPKGRIRDNIERQRDRQMKFSLDTANNIRGRLRRTNFAIYKRGNKGFAFVSAVRRKFLFEGDKLSELPQKIYEFILANAGIPAVEMPYKFLGKEMPKEQNSAKEATLEQVVNEGDTSTSTPENAAEKTESLDEETLKQLAQIASELHWLVSEGYVVEYSDSTLQANPYLPKPKNKSQTAEDLAKDLGDKDEPIAVANVQEEQKSESSKPESESATDESPKEELSEISGTEDEPIAVADADCQAHIKDDVDTTKEEK